MLYDSLHEKLVVLKNLSTDTVSTIGVQRSFNYALQPMSREQFIEIVTADQPDAPPYFTYDAVLNARERPTLEQALEQELKPLSLDEVVALAAEGAQILDTREPAQFAGAHLRGAINIGLGGSYATWCGTVLDRELPIVLVSGLGSELEAVTRLGRIGFDSVVGYLAGGMQPLEDAPELIERIERIMVRSLAELLASSTPLATPAEGRGAGSSRQQDAVRARSPPAISTFVSRAADRLPASSRGPSDRLRHPIRGYHQPAPGPGALRAGRHHLVRRRHRGPEARHPVNEGDFPDDYAWIDFAGPPGTVPTYSFSDVLLGHVPARAFAGKIVIVGYTDPSLNDIFKTPVSDNYMSGPEVHVNAVDTSSVRSRRPMSRPRAESATHIRLISDGAPA
ncbi:MAG: CHASE2 domain-containing protein [Solirubrobacteraceae bacterium]